MEIMKLIKISSPGILIRSFIAAFIIIAASQNVFSQFGQNKVQYKVFDWKYLQSQHFDIYFNQGGEFIAQFTAVAAESSLVSLENNIGYGIKSQRLSISRTMSSSRTMPLMSIYPKVSAV